MNSVLVKQIIYILYLTSGWQQSCYIHSTSFMLFGIKSLEEEKNPVMSASEDWKCPCVMRWMYIRFRVISSKQQINLFELLDELGVANPYTAQHASGRASAHKWERAHPKNKHSSFLATENDTLNQYKIHFSLFWIFVDMARKFYV